MAVFFFLFLEQRGEGLDVFLRVNAAHRVVRRVDDHGGRLFVDGLAQSVDVQLEIARAHGHLDAGALRRRYHDAILGEERRVHDDFIAGMRDGGHRDVKRRRGTRRQVHVVERGRNAETLTQIISHRLARRLQTGRHRVRMQLLGRLFQQLFDASAHCGRCRNGRVAYGVIVDILRADFGLAVEAIRIQLANHIRLRAQLVHALVDHCNPFLETTGL